MNSIYCIGDIHGMYDEYLKLYDKIADHQDSHRQESTLVFVGDYIDRGPKSMDVLYSVRELTKQGSVYFNKVVALKGNHEDMMLKANDSYSDQNLFLSNGGYQTLESFGFSKNSTERSVRAIVNDDMLWSWIRDLPTSFVQHNVAVAHAGIDDEDFSVDDHTANQLLWSRRLRMHEHNIYKYTAHGHTPMKEAIVGEHVAYIDTGCVFGGKLSCLFIPDTVNPNHEEMELIQV